MFSNKEKLGFNFGKFMENKFFVSSYFENFFINFSLRIVCITSLRFHHCVKKYFSLSLKDTYILFYYLYYKIFVCAFIIGVFNGAFIVRLTIWPMLNSNTWFLDAWIWKTIKKHIDCIKLIYLYIKSDIIQIYK